MYDWKTTYPSLATVMVASFGTIHTWVENLPPPQNDVERTVARRMRKRLQDLFPGELRQQAPEVADKYEALLDRINKLVG